MNSATDGKLLQAQGHRTDDVRISASPGVSVVMTVYNGEKYLDRALPGILAQTHPNFEVVIVDDGSTDRTYELLAERAREDERIRLFRPGRLGRAGALNFGVEQARAPYIAQQDFDDVSYPERLRLQCEFLDSHPEVGLVGSHYVLVDDNRGERFVRMPPTEHYDIVRAMARYIPFAHTMATFRKQAWAQVGGYPNVTNILDLRFAVALAAAGWRLANLPEVLGEHWVHPDSFWHRSFRYRDRQKELARVQASAVKLLGLPSWMYVYAASRRVYAWLPDVLKRAVRRSLGGSRERDLG